MAAVVTSALRQRRSRGECVNGDSLSRDYGARLKRRVSVNPTIAGPQTTTSGTERFLVAGAALTRRWIAFVRCVTEVVGRFAFEDHPDVGEVEVEGATS